MFVLSPPSPNHKDNHIYRVSIKDVSQVERTIYKRQSGVGDRELALETVTPERDS